ncbi:MAG: Uncharacterised protein [SAR116 cluster bacterium]|nr:MAG: Uncharacterised protein [SAR116 cluster bacterium]
MPQQGQQIDNRQCRAARPVPCPAFTVCHQQIDQRFQTVDRHGQSPIHIGLAKGKVGHGNEPPQDFAVAYGYTGVWAAMSPFEGNGRAIAQRELQGPSVDKTSDD